jgi:uncharacterized protein (TIGR02391 family)
MAANYRMIATQVGDSLKYATTVNEVNRAATSVFRFIKEHFPNDSITSVRAQEVYDWVLSLAKQSLTTEDRDKQLRQFLSIVTPEDMENTVNKVLKAAGLGDSKINQVPEEFLNRGFHELVHKHSRKLFVQGNYFHSVFEAAKAYNKLVQSKAKSQKDGQPLMMDVLSLSGTLKLNKGVTETEKNVQEGVMFLSAGLMRALRNPAAHEPALDWPISKEDCLDMLSFISYLCRQLDHAIYFAGASR